MILISGIWPKYRVKLDNEKEMRGKIRNSDSVRKYSRLLFILKV